LDEAQAMLDRVTATAAVEGLVYRLDVARPANTFDAHRLLHLAGERGRRAELEEQLMAACLTRGESVGDPELLVRGAVGAGLDGDDARAVLAGDAYAGAVRADEEEARRLGIHAVPFFVIDGQGLAGAQPADTLLAALERAHAAPATLE
ncbi:MAG: DsbA family oxidoreductase, partial [Acidimicrobiales bacterium]